MSVVESIYRNNENRILITESMRTRPVISLKERIKKGGKGLIVEYKRASPSGFSGSKFQNVNEFAVFIKNYSTAISVLSEPDYFNGALDDAVKLQSLQIPMLMKDFVDRESMILTGFNAGYDAVLLIADFLKAGLIVRLTEYAKKLGMDCLVEFHSLDSYEKIPEGENIMVGYNRRNLKTLNMEPEERSALELIKKRDSKILESGIDSKNYRELFKMDFDAYLVGSSILKEPNFLVELKEEGNNYHVE